VRTIHPLAEKLNDLLRNETPFLYDALSELGKNLYYPAGILTQTREAGEKAWKFNATIGIALKDGRPLHLETLHGYFPDLEPEEAFPYAPTTGIPELRLLWKKHQMEANPSLEGKSYSLPLVTSGITHALSICADLFCDPGDIVLVPDMMWGNYRLVFGTRRGADIRTYPLFNGNGGLDLSSFRGMLHSFPRGSKVLVILNFPHNPTGYSPTREEADLLARILLEAAEEGLILVVLVDDAYFGLFYEEESCRQSLFSLLAESHPRLVAVKLDGATKEDYAWGLRVGFLAFSVGGADRADEVYAALEEKAGGIIRGTVSVSSTLAQNLLVRAMKSPAYREEKEMNYRAMKERYLEAKKALSRPDLSTVLHPYPFNSGYFLCLRVEGVEAETLRRHLLEKHGVGVISVGPRDLRIAFSCLEREQVKELFDILYSAVRELSGRNDRKP
jgi:aspartate/methionine/tyrosine aminotransferase